MTVMRTIGIGCLLTVLLASWGSVSFLSPTPALAQNDAYVSTTAMDADERFRQRVRSALFTHSPEGTGALRSPILRVDYDRHVVAVLIDTLSTTERAEYERHLNRLIFAPDGSAVAYFRSDDPVRQAIIEGLALDFRPDYVMDVYYDIQPNTLDAVAEAVLTKQSGQWSLNRVALDDIYRFRSAWIAQHYPDLIKKYNLTLEQKGLLACYLYLDGDPYYLQMLYSRDPVLASGYLDPVLESFGIAPEGLHQP